MSRVPSLKPNEVIKALEKIGFEQIRQKGSHLFLRHPDGRTTVVPVHLGRDIDRKLMLKIIKDTKLTPREFQEFV